MATSNSWHRISPAAPSQAWSAPRAGIAELNLAGWAAKRLLDLSISCLSLVLLSPVLAAIAVAIRLDSPGPVLFRSRRIGKHGRTFQCFKFRTMDGDSRVTRFGAWMRRFGIDEMPQLLNVLRGEMSIVGPRPPLAGASPVPNLRRFHLRPGITGLWPLENLRSAALPAFLTPEEAYRKEWSPWRDIAIMLRTFGVALAGRGC